MGPLHTESQQKILRQQLEEERANLSGASDPETKQNHARNIIAISRTLAGKGTDLPPNDDPNPDYLAQVNQGGDFQFSGLPGRPNQSTDSGFKFVGLDASRNAVEDIGYEPPPGIPTSTIKSPGRVITETPGGAATNVSAARVARGTADPITLPPSAARFATEAGLSTVGGGLGAMAGPGGAIAGSAAGGFVGSLLSETFDPTEKPLTTALQAGGMGAGGELVGLGVGKGIKALIGKPNEAGEWLLTAAEKAGHVPPPGAVIPDSAFLRFIESIGAADNFVGQKLKDSLAKTNGIMTDEIKQYTLSYMRTKMEADRAFAAWDKVVEKGLGSSGIVRVDKPVVDALIPLIKGWEELGLITKLDSNLVKKVKAAQAAMQEGNRVAGLNLSMSEAEAARTLMHRASMNAAKSTTTAKKAIADSDYAIAYREFGEDVGAAMDTAIGKAVTDKRLPDNARATLQGARDLWTKWKTGEALIDELTIPLKAAERADGPLKSTELYAALKRLDKAGEKVGRAVITKEQSELLSGMARAMEQTEKVGKSVAFTWAVRAGQLGLLIGGASGATPGSVAALAMTPAAITWMLTNPRAAAFVIRGMKMEPGTAQAVRAARQFTTMGIRAGVFPPDRQYQDEEDALMNYESITIPRAEGGPIDAGEWYLVGEQGPEMVVPDDSLDGIFGDELASGWEGAMATSANQNAARAKARKMGAAIKKAGEAMNPAASPASGGPDTSNPYLVGTKGPEVIAPTLGGYVMNNKSLQELFPNMGNRVRNSSPALMYRNARGVRG